MPKWLIFSQGLHPRPGPESTVYNAGFDDPQGIDWDDEFSDEGPWDPASEVASSCNSQPGTPRAAAASRGTHAHMAVQPAGSRASPGGEASQGDEGRDAWEEMQQGGMADKLAEEFQRTLDDIGCPRVGAPVDRTHLTGQAWKDPDDVDDQPPALDESSDEELQEDMGQQKASNTSAWRITHTTSLASATIGRLELQGYAEERLSKCLELSGTVGIPWRGH